MPEFPVPWGNASASFGVTPGESSLAHQFTSPDDGTKGAWSEIVASTPFAANWISYQLQKSNAQAYVDIGVGASGSEVVVIPEVWAPQFWGDTTERGPSLFPLFIPAGSRIAVRARNSAFFVATHIVNLTLFGGGMSGSVPGPSIVSKYGTATQWGTNIDPGSTPETDSAWVQITAATERHHNWLVVDGRIGDESPGTDMSWRVTLGIGGSGSEVPIGTFHFAKAALDTNTVTSGLPVYLPLSIPAGTRIVAKVRASSGTNNDRDVWLSVFGC